MPGQILMSGGVVDLKHFEIGILGTILTVILAWLGRLHYIVSKGPDSYVSHREMDQTLKHLEDTINRMEANRREDLRELKGWMSAVSKKIDERNRV